LSASETHRPQLGNIPPRVVAMVSPAFAGRDPSYSTEAIQPFHRGIVDLENPKSFFENQLRSRIDGYTKF
jgi:hypothetical protein